MKLIALTTLLMLGMLILVPPRAVAADVCEELGCVQDGIPVIIPHSTSFEFNEGNLPSGHTEILGLDQETEVIEYQNGNDQLTRKHPGTSCTPSGLVCTDVRVEEVGDQALVISVTVDFTSESDEP